MPDLCLIFGLQVEFEVLDEVLKMYFEGFVVLLDVVRAVG